METNITIELNDKLCLEIPQLGQIISDLAQAAAIIHQQGWAEANAGNISYRITNLILPWLQRTSSDESARDWFLVSRSGSRYRELSRNPMQSLMLVSTGDRMRFYPSDAVPSSEWGCHLRVHELDKSNSFPCLLHTHPTELIALSHTALFNDEEAMNKQLSELLPELPLYLPTGVACSAYAMPGSQELAELSALRFRDKKALIWQKHGLMCRAGDVNQALDYLEIINKAAKLYFLCKA